MKKLESLKSSKFEAFKENELENAFKVVGGAPVNTTYKNHYYTGADVMDTSTHPSWEMGSPQSYIVGQAGSIDYQTTSWNPKATTIVNSGGAPTST